MPDKDLAYLHPQLRPLAVAMNTLTPDKRNARRRDARAMSTLKASIADKGFRSVIVVQKDPSGELIIRAGNGRFQAMQELGHAYIPALVFEEGDTSAVEFAIADNRTAELAEWDFEALGEHLAALGSGAMEGLGFTQDEVATLLLDSSWDDADIASTDAEDAKPSKPSTPVPVSDEDDKVVSEKIVLIVTDPTCTTELHKLLRALLTPAFTGKVSMSTKD